MRFQKKSGYVAALVFVATAFMAYAAYAQTAVRTINEKPPRTLSFYNTHTHEVLDVEYWNNEGYVTSALSDINYHMRDHRSGDVTKIDPDVLNFLHEIQMVLKARYPEKDLRIHVISGYRSPATNAMLRANGGGQGKKSRHMFGEAIDFRIPGIDTAEIRDIAYCMKRGGVGYYRGSDFVHIDSYTVRNWNWTPSASVCSKTSS